MISEPNRPSEDALSKALGAFHAFNASALEQAVTSALMRNEAALERTNAASAPLERAAATA